MRLKLRIGHFSCWRITLMFLGLCLGCGCDKHCVLFSELEERQANSVMATLAVEGIKTRKASASEGMWQVQIAEEQFAEATMLLEQKGLPERRYQGVGEVFRKTGMVSSPSEERIRFMDALSQDLAQTLSAIDGVVDARVHIVLPENDPFAKETLPSSAAVAIRHQWDADVTGLIPLVKGLVAHAIEGLDARNVSVTLFRDAPLVQRKIEKASEMNTRTSSAVWKIAIISGIALVASTILLCLAMRLYRQTSHSNASIKSI